MEDVIFAGTSSRAPLGRAEVTVTIDNSDNALPIEYSEVSITRRMFRDGASEYEINGSSCRLMDVQELLSDSGIGREMHVIVGQGKLDEILQSRPEDRRAFIEEAAGVLKHRKRKEKALRKLDAMSANLARLTDLTTELRRQLKPLGRQAEIARRAQTIQADLRDARLRLAADDLVNRQVERDADPEVETAMRREHDEAAARLAVAYRGTDRPRDRGGRALRCGPSRSSRPGFGCPRWPNASARRCASPANAPSTSTSSRWPPATRPEPEALEAEAEEVEVAEQQAARRARRRARPAGRGPRRAGRARARSPPRPNAPTWRRCARRPTGARGWRGWPARSRRCGPASSRSTTASRGCPNASRRRAARAQQAQGGVRDRAGPRRRARPGRGRASTSTTTGRSRRCGWPTNGWPNCRPPSAAPNARWLRCGPASTPCRSVSNARTARRWLTEHLSGAGLFGPIAKLVKVSAGYEAALAAVLGAAADAVAADNFGAARSAVAALKDADGGRAAIVLGDWPAARRPPDDALPAGALWALDLVEAPARLHGAMTAMLSGVAVVDDLARRAGPGGSRPRLRAVTLDGDLVGAGWVSGGSDRKPSTLEITSEIDKAASELAAAETQADRADRRALRRADRAGRPPGRRRAGAGRAQRVRRRDLGDLRAARPARAGGARRRGGVDRLLRQRDELEAGRAQTVEELTELETRLRNAQETQHVHAEEPSHAEVRQRDRRRRRSRPRRRGRGPAGGAHRRGTRECRSRTGGFAAPRGRRRTRGAGAGAAGAGGAARTPPRWPRRSPTPGGCWRSGLTGWSPRRRATATSWPPNARRGRRRCRRCARRSTR